MIKGLAMRKWGRKRAVAAVMINLLEMVLALRAVANGPQDQWVSDIQS
jgi:hypothetical protein